MDMLSRAEQSPMLIQYLIQALRNGSLRPPTPYEERQRNAQISPQAPQAPDERAITQYAGDSPLQRRMREAGLE